MPTVWNSEDDHSRSQDNSGFTNDGLGDHANRDTLQRGYEYGSLTRGLVAYYPMEEGEGAVLHDGALDNLGQINGASWNGSGQVGSDCLSFDGTDDLVNAGDGPALNFGSGDFSLAAWFNTNGSSNAQRIVGKQKDSSPYQGYFINLKSDNSLRGYLEDGSGNVIDISSSETVNTNEWNHAAIARNGADLELYLNGVLVATGTDSTLGDTDHPNGFGIGARAGDTSLPFDGTIDYVKVYSRCVSQQEIDALASMTSPSGREVVESDVPTQSDNGVSRYEFSSGSLTADSWGSNTLTDNTSAGTATGVYGQAKSFDGTDDYMTVPAFSTFSSYTISSWFYLRTNDSDTDTILSIEENNNFRFESLGSSGELRVRHLDSGSNPYTISTAIPTDEWGHVVATWDGSILRFYFNGALVGEVSGVSDMQSVSRQTEIGRQGASNGRYWDGHLDDVRIFSDAKSASEIESLYNLGAWRVSRGAVV